MEQLLGAAGAAIETTPPAIGVYWPGQGGIYVGLAAADGDLPQGHLVLAAETSEKDFSWVKAKAFAADVSADGHTDFRLPTRFEAALIYANARSHVDTARWHWTGTEQGASYAWYCSFSYGQVYYYKSSAGAARAVRRFVF